MTLRFIGQRNSLGGGTFFSNFVDAVRAFAALSPIVEEIDITDSAALESARARSAPDDINVWWWPDREIVDFKGTHVMWAVFEFERLPQHYRDYVSEYVSVLLAPTSWAEAVLRRNGVPDTLIERVPEGIDAHQYHPFARSQLDRSGTPFRFLAVGKFERRKGYDALFQAFADAFGDADDVELVIKADHFREPARAQREIEALRERTGLRQLRPFWGEWTTEQLFGLYNYCDAFVFPSRAEGWGLPLLEAAATGLPVISTDCTGHHDILEHLGGSYLPIAHRSVAIDDPEFLRYWAPDEEGLGDWAEPDVASLAAALTRMKNDPTPYQEAARRNAIGLLEGFSWRSSAVKALDALARRGLLDLHYRVIA